MEKVLDMKTSTPLVERVLILHRANDFGSALLSNPIWKPYGLRKIRYPFLGAAEPTMRPAFREWIDACNELHADICIPKSIPQQPHDDRPLWLIDTEEQRIVYGSSAHRYLALSYTWPETRDCSAPAPRSLLLDAASLADLRKPGCFSSTAITERLPGVIKHAMRVTAALGERYLWVDRLCIVQNDAETLGEVTKMDKIYAGAYLTIIAAAPDVMYQDDQGSEWPCFCSVNGSPGSVFWKPIQDRYVYIMDSHYEVLRESRWATRGWTYQEQILCKRAVIFTAQGFFWDCQCCMWDGEDLKPDQDFKTMSPTTDMGQRFATRWWPDFGFYIDLICPYNGREFSYPEDALLGISGILRALSRSFPGKFVSGVPTLFLDHALLWQPFETAERRTDRYKTAGTSGTSSSLPSWAWCGWQCFVDPQSLRSGLAYIDDEKIRNRARSWQTRNLVEWRMVNGQAQSELIREPNVFEEHVKMADSPDALLPENWHSHGKPGTESLRFSHATDPELFFKHPVPLAAGAPQPKLCTVSHLAFRTTTAAFLPAVVMRPGRVLKGCIRASTKVSVFEDRMFSLGPRDGKVPPVLVLQQPNGMFAGLLRLMNHDAIDLNELIELVALSTGSAKAIDLRCSREWRVFAYENLSYVHGNERRCVFFSSPRLTRLQKRALLFDLAMAFDAEAAKGADSSLVPELEALDAQVHSQVESEMEKHHEHLSQLGRDEAYRVAFEQKIWSQKRQVALSKRGRSEAVDPAIVAPTATFATSAAAAAAAASAALVPTTAADDDTTHLFYNVLWIQRRDGIAYRAACGWVPKCIWEAHATGPVDVTLG